MLVAAPVSTTFMPPCLVVIDREAPRECMEDPGAELRPWSFGSGGQLATLWPYCTYCGCWSDLQHLYTRRHQKALRTLEIFHSSETQAGIATLASSSPQLLKVEDLAKIDCMSAQVVPATQTAAPPQPQEESLDQQIRLLEAVLIGSSEWRGSPSPPPPGKPNAGAPLQLSRCLPPPGYEPKIPSDLKSPAAQDASQAVPASVVPSVHAGVVGNANAAAVGAEAGGANCGGPVACPNMVRTGAASAAQRSTRAQHEDQAGMQAQTSAAPARLQVTAKAQARAPGQARHSAKGYVQAVPRLRDHALAAAQSGAKATMDEATAVKEVPLPTCRWRLAEIANEQCSACAATYELAPSFMVSPTAAGKSANGLIEV